MELPLATLNWQNPIGLAGLGDMLAIVKQADYVVTDIYHLAVSAWREGVPALCVGNGGSYPQSTVSDKKKEILYGQIFASDMYLYVEEILDALRRDAELTNYCGRQVKRLCNDQANQVVHEMIDRQRRVARAHLVEALQR